MSRRRTDLPIMIGRNLSKGLMAIQSYGTFERGIDLYIVWLNEQKKAREPFELDDIRSVDAVLHFCDRESIQQTVELLSTVLNEWEIEPNKMP